MSHISSLPRAIFDFKQCKKESIGTAWARFSMLLHTGPDLSLPDGMILCLFCLGLHIANLCLDMTTRGNSHVKCGGILIGESNHIPSIDSTYEPPPKPRTPKEWVIYPSEFPIEFKDHGITSNLPWHEESTFLSKEVYPNVEPLKEWLMEVKCSSEAI
jgi:hypothetical protein